MAEPALLHTVSPEPEQGGAVLRAVPGAASGVRPGPASAAPEPVPGGRSGAAATPRLEIPPYDLAAALALERELGISHAFAQVLIRRGLRDVGSARAFLEPREAHPPDAFEGIDRAVALIERHIRSGGRITVHGDYDVDGVCATATMVRALRSRGANVGWFLPSRIDDGYGLSPDTVRRLAARGTKLLITVDCAITAVSEVAAARAAGVDVVVSDHHAPRADGELPPCPIVHPSLCGYPCPDLCGTGVAFKLAQALGAVTAEEDIELVALATVADLMPLRGENRRLVREGLSALANTAKPGLRALMAVSRTDPSGLDTGALGFRLAPRINAAGRLRRADAGLELLLTEDPSRAAEIAAELDAVNVERRAVEQRLVWEAEAQVADLGVRSAYVLAGEGWHPGVIGIVASRIVERHHRPTILVALEGDLGAGSGRSIPGFDLLAALHAGAGHLERYGGHRAAAGLTVRRDAVDAFRACFEAHAEAVLTPELLEPTERIDAIVSGSELGLAFADELASLEPCGIGNPRSRLLVPGARFDDVRPMGEGRHARFSVTSAGTRARAVVFGCEGRLGVDPGEPVNATFRLERNVWNGAVEPRLVLQHARRCAPDRIEVLGEGRDFLHSALEELDTALEPEGTASPPAAAAEARTLLDRRGESPLAVLGDALAAGGPVLAICADVPRRLRGMSSRGGGFSLTSYHALHREGVRLGQFPQLVALDPPARAGDARLLAAGSGVTHWAWGEAELRFAQQMHELEYGLRASLASLYRSLRSRWRVTGEELERLLRGDIEPGRPARLAGRLIRVLAELELVSLDRDLPALAIAGTAPTVLERSPAYRVYAQRLEDGRRYLSSVNLRPSG
jgi:single-stranded-DNA-specific exonuclease